MGPTGAALLTALSIFVVSCAVHAQLPAPAAPSAPASAPGPAWNTLTPAQRTALAPLASKWSALTDGQRRKWIALAPSYATLSAGEQAKMHSRMAEWAALSPKDRAMARLNFEQTRKLTPDDRTAKWEAYQALPEEDRQKFSSEPVRKPAGAAVAVKPVAPSRVAEVPAPRHTQESKASLVKNPDMLDRKTLLPKARAASAASAPAASPAVLPASAPDSEPAKP